MILCNAPRFGNVGLHCTLARGHAGPHKATAEWGDVPTLEGSGAVPLTVELHRPLETRTDEAPPLLDDDEHCLAGPRQGRHKKR